MAFRRTKVFPLVTVLEFSWKLNHRYKPCLYPCCCAILKSSWGAADTATALFDLICGIFTKDGCLLHIQTCLSPSVLRPMMSSSIEFRKAVNHMSPSSADADDWYWLRKSTIHPYLQYTHQQLLQYKRMPSFSHAPSSWKKVRERSWRIAYQLLTSRDDAAERQTQQGNAHIDLSPHLRPASSRRQPMDCNNIILTHDHAAFPAIWCTMRSKCMTVYNDVPYLLSLSL